MVRFMKFLWVLAVLIFCSPLIRAADATPEADATWADIVKNSKPPVPPAEWNKKPPTAEESAEFKRKAGDAAEELADRIKKFYESYPDHAKVAEAKQKEQVFRKQAAALHGAKAEPKQVAADAPKKGAPTEPDMDPAFKAKYMEAVSRIRELRKDGPPAVAAELERSGHALAKEFPKQMEPWQMLMTVAQFESGEKAIALFKEVAAGAPDERMKKVAEVELKKMDQLNKPIALAYKAVDGRDVDVSKMKGKVVLVDFWATWCGPCVAELPNVKKAYADLHDKGFEIVGVSFDQDCDALKKFVEKQKMAWPQFCDGGGWQNAINKDFGINAIPAMYLVDKKGNLRDMNGRENLVEKVRAMLEEKE
jgi:thiol-disulfide isomerase/thioredoxin